MNIQRIIQKRKMERQGENMSEEKQGVYNWHKLPVFFRTSYGECFFTNDNLPGHVWAYSNYNFVIFIVNFVLLNTSIFLFR